MCMHEGQPCPGRSCQCECMNCMFPEDDDDAGMFMNSSLPDN